MIMLVVLLCFLAVTFTLAVAARVGMAEFSEPTLLPNSIELRRWHGVAHVFGTWAATMGPGIIVCSSVGLGPMGCCLRFSGRGAKGESDGK